MKNLACQKTDGWPTPPREGKGKGQSYFLGDPYTVRGGEREEKQYRIEGAGFASRYTFNRKKRAMLLNCLQGATGKTRGEKRGSGHSRPSYR